MINKHVLLAHFRANGDRLLTADGVALNLHLNRIVELSVGLKNKVKYPYSVQISAEFTLDDFLTEMDLQFLDDLSEIDLNTLLGMLMRNKAAYQIIRD